MQSYPLAPKPVLANGAPKPEPTLKTVERKVGAAMAAMRTKEDHRKSSEVPPMPPGAEQNSTRELIINIVEADGPTEVRDPATIGRHLELLDAPPSKIKSVAPSHAGITTRAIWLDWEGQKHKILPPPGAQDLPDFLQGKLYKKQQHSSSSFVLRDFRADMVPGSLSYANKKDVNVTLWLTPGCVVQRIEGEAFSRKGCIRIVWPNGYDIILSPIDEEPSASEWYTYICALLAPPPKFAAKRLALTRSNPLPAALHRNAIRSQKSKETVPYGLTNQANLSKLVFKFRASFSDVFSLLRDEVQFQEMYRTSFDPNGLQYSRFATGHPFYKYTELPEIHYAYLPSTTELSEAWEALLTAFPNRHQEELRRFLVDSNGDATKAEVALTRHIQWRGTMMPIRPQPLTSSLETGKCYVRGMDFYGNPLLHFVVSRHCPSMAKNDKRAMEIDIRACLYRLEQALARLPFRDGKVSILLRLDNAGPENKDLFLLSQLGIIITEQYRERLHSLVVFPSTSKLTLAASVAALGMTIPAKIAARTLCAPDLAALKGYLPAASIPLELGGEDPYSVASDPAAAQPQSQSLSPYQQQQSSFGDEYESQVERMQRQGQGQGQGGLSGSLASSPWLLPPLWLSPQSQDYYPPPPLPINNNTIDVSIAANAAAAVSKNVRFVCASCSKRVGGEIGVSRADAWGVGAGGSGSGSEVEGVFGAGYGAGYGGAGFGFDGGADDDFAAASTAGAGAGAKAAAAAGKAGGSKARSGECAVCRYVTREDVYYSGWVPLDPEKYPEPSRDAFLALKL